MNLKKLDKATNITGAIMIMLLLIGAFANAYGANIKITYITTLSLVVLPVVLLLVYKNKL